MAVFKVETKNKVDIDKKPRVYFTCHPEDFEKYFKKVCDDIFKTHDCAIYYTEDMTEVIAKEERETDLGRNNLFVIPVTFKLLTTPNRAMDEDFPYALKEHIPVLPIMMEPGIDELYSKPDKFGEMQYLNPYSTDLTEISYEEKLKKYLESVLISDELAKRVRAAFAAYIFLSYRKKDRKYANELMRLIHSIPECRDIAIWFDEFLTPGESFKENIEKIMDDCKLFTLLVTPQLLEKVIDENGKERDNYVISTELPLARKKKEEKGTDIFAVEMEKTDREALSAISIDDYTNPENADFRARLLKTISCMAITTNNTPEHNFLIGLAYLKGVDVEVDHDKGRKLIVDSAKSEWLEAIRKMVVICKTTYPVDKDEISEWLNIAVLVAEKEFRKTRDNCAFQTLLEDVVELFDLQMHHKVQNAKEVFVRIVQLDSFLIENGLYQEHGATQKLRAACANLFRHRAKKFNILGGREDGYRDWEEWLIVYEEFCLRNPDMAKGELAFAYQNYTEILEEEKAFEASIIVANKLLQLSLKEKEKFKVQLREDYSSKSYFDVPKDVGTYTFWLEMTLSGYLHIAIASKENQKQRLISIKNLLLLAENLRRHAITYTTCGNIAHCYNLLGRTLEKIGKNNLSQKANEYADLIEAGMPMRRKFIPKYDEELHAVIDILIKDAI